MRPTLAISVMLVTVVMCAAAVAPSPAPAPMQVKALAKNIDELIEWIYKGAKQLPKAQADEVVDVLRRYGAKGDDIAPEVASILRRDLNSAAQGVLDADLLRLMSRAPTVREGAWALALKAKVREPGARLTQLAADLGTEAPTAMGRMAALMDTQDCAVLMRGLSPRMLSRSQVEQIVAGLKRAELSPTAQGEVFESVARAQLSGGALKARSGLKEGSRVIVGKHNSKHGIDGIGVGPDGKPVIFEFSMYDKKALGPDTDGLVQLSPEWVADRWSKMVAAATPARLDELRAMGVDPKWLNPVAAADAGSWARKLVVAHDSALTDTNRLAAKLGPDDLMVLGGK